MWFPRRYLKFRTSGELQHTDRLRTSEIHVKTDGQFNSYDNKFTIELINMNAALLSEVNLVRESCSLRGVFGNHLRAFLALINVLCQSIGASVINDFEFSFSCCVLFYNSTLTFLLLHCTFVSACEVNQRPCVYTKFLPFRHAPTYWCALQSGFDLHQPTESANIYAA